MTPAKLRTFDPTINPDLNPSDSIKVIPLSPSKENNNGSRSLLDRWY